MKSFGIKIQNLSYVQIKEMRLL